MSELTFNDGVLKFITDISNKFGDDLVYSLALQNNNLFFIVTAQPTVTNKKFDLENSERAMFLIDKNEYDSTQDEIVEQLTKQISSYLILDPIVLQ
jgi:hypothetical protein